MRVWALVLMLSACSFAGSSPGLDDDGVEPDSSDADSTDASDATDGLTCGDVTCSPNATCDPDTASCACSPGFVGDGVTCDDRNECADSSAGCPALCVNVIGSFQCAAPATCAERKAVDPAAVADGDYRLWLGGDSSRPVAVYCHDMANTPREYLNVSDTFSQYSEGGSSPGSDVRTTYTRVRLRLQPLGIEISDRTFASSTGELNHSNMGPLVTSMPVGVAMDCGGGGSSEGVARVGVPAPFAIAQLFSRGGADPGGSVSRADNDRTVMLTGGGGCGWHGPAPDLYDPYNDNAAGKVLALSYAP